MEVPCYNCEKRTLGCHSKCEEYKGYAQKNMDNNEKRRESHVKRKLVEDFEFGIKTKMLKRYRRGKR